MPLRGFFMDECGEAVEAAEAAETAKTYRCKRMHMKSLSLSAQSYIFRPQLAKRIQESTFVTCV